MLLAVLLLHANAVVSRGELVDALWGERPPTSAAESLDTYVYRLRKVLGADRLLREAGGYRLRVAPGERDIDWFDELVTTARGAVVATDYAAAMQALTEALGLWRGPAWADQLDHPAVRADAERLEEQRLGALESRLETELAIGRGAELVAELEQLTGEHPLRERLLAALMLALYRAGRQTDALEVFHAARHRLIDELGLEPGPGLHELQHRILRHDPTLGSPRGFLALSVPRGRRTFALAGGAAVLLVVAAVVAGGFGAATIATRATCRRLPLSDKGGHQICAADVPRIGVIRPRRGPLASSQWAFPCATPPTASRASADRSRLRGCLRHIAAVGGERLPR
jgi:DNA-binding SARP family transcriptional activator